MQRLGLRSILTLTTLSICALTACTGDPAAANDGRRSNPDGDTSSFGGDPNGGDVAPGDQAPGDSATAGDSDPGGDCTPGARRCNAGSAETCTDGIWVHAQDCQFVCQTGACTGVCSPGAIQCNGNMTQRCDSTGAWQDETSCPFVCSEGVCAGSCVSGSVQCSASIRQACQQGEWVDQQTCPYVCMDGACTGVCVPGSKDCDGYIPRTCNSLGQWGAQTECPFVCLDGECTGECRPGTKGCQSPTHRTVCDVNGYWPTLVTSAYWCEYGCSDLTGTPKCNECTPSGSRCISSTEKQNCNADGTIAGSETCAFGCGDNSPGQCNPPPILRIVNDLPSGTVGGTNWTQVNSIIRVRIGPSWAEVSGSNGSSYERLWPYDSASTFEQTETIYPGRYREFDVVSNGPNYTVYIQAGWWDYLCFNNICSWNKHVSVVTCCDCSSVCHKYAGVNLTNHIWGAQVLNLSDWLPIGVWCTSSFCQ